MADIFLSYSSEDRERMAPLARALEQAGFSVWWDRDIRPGSDFAQTIETEIGAARVVLVAWSETSARSEWVRDEAIFARKANKLIPLLISGDEPPMGFRQVQALDFRSWRNDADAPAFAALCAAISQMLSGEAAPVRNAASTTSGFLRSVDPRMRPRNALIAGAAFVALLALGVASLFVWRPGHQPGEPAAVNPPSPDPGVVAQAVPDASIAVLPFENLSSDKDNLFFAIGVQDEILTRLTKIGSLKVISRTSTAHFASKPDNLPEIAKQLGVAYILEGSVQREKDAVRITVQLINAATDGHLWAESYDRELDDIFRVQSEVATAIAEALNAKVTGSEKLALDLAPTKNLAAYDAYLRGLASWRNSVGVAPPNAEAFLEQAVSLDPDYAIAWAWLVKVHAFFSATVEQTEERRAAARSALDTALRLQPEGVEALLAQAFYQYWVERDYASARRRFEQVLAVWPNNAEVLNALGLIARRQGRWEQSNAYLRQAVRLDPLSRSARFDEAQTRRAMRDFVGAQRLLDDALNIWPDDLAFIGYKASVYQSLGQLEQADELLKPLRPRPEDELAIAAIVDQARYRRRYAEAIRALERLVELDEANGSRGWRSSDLILKLGGLRRLSGDSAGAGINYIAARDQLLSELRRQPENARVVRDLAKVYCELGEFDLAMSYANRAVNLRPVEQEAMEGGYFEEVRARILARFGDREHAVPALARLLNLPSRLPLTPAILRLDPDFDTLRGDPRFEALLVEDGSP